MKTAKVRVLLVGDHPRVFSSWRRHLEANGCHCEFAECEREVWNVLEQSSLTSYLVCTKAAAMAPKASARCCPVQGLPCSMHYPLKTVVGGCYSPGRRGMFRRACIAPD